MRLFPYYLLLVVLIWNAVWSAQYSINHVIQSNEDKLRNLQQVNSEGPLRIYTSDGLLIGEYRKHKKSYIPLNELPHHLINSVLTQEDQYFWEHSGVSVRSLLRAARDFLSKGKIVSGGSTITMQLVKNLVLSPERSLTRKIKEILITRKVEDMYTKKEILEIYLNNIYFGKNCIGIGAAAQQYFGKLATDLTPSESIRLAITIRAPSIYHPGNETSYTISAFQSLSNKMLDQKLITQGQWNELQIPAITSKPAIPLSIKSLSYVRDLAYSKLVSDFGETVIGKGLDVTLTIDSKTQKVAEASLQWGLTAYERRSSSFYTIPESAKTIGNLIATQITSIGPYSITVSPLKGGKLINIFEEGLKSALIDNLQEDGLLTPGTLDDVFQIGDKLYIEKDPYRGWLVSTVPQADGSVTIIDHNTGEVKAIVGGFDYDSSQFNRATQAKRQIASTIKPFLYMLALEKGRDINSEIDLNLTHINEEWPFLINKNSTAKLTLKEALIQSNNQASVALLHEVGIDSFIDYMSRLDFDMQQYKPTHAMALGIYESNTYSMATAYSSLANGGRRIEPSIIKNISYRNSKSTKFNTDLCTSCINPKVNPAVFSRANDIKALLQEVVTSGTAKRAKLIHSKEVGGKTGTSNNAHDVWFSGFVNNLTISVWAGGDLAFDLGSGEYGSSIALPIWVEIAENLLAIEESNQDIHQAYPSSN